jgi:hypothetical protein
MLDFLHACAQRRRQAANDAALPLQRAKDARAGAK